MGKTGHSSTSVAVHAFVDSLDAIVHHLSHNSAAFKQLSEGQAVAFAEFGWYAGLAVQALANDDADKFGECMLHISKAAVNGAFFGVPGLVTAIVNTGISVKNELDGGHTLTPGDRFDRALHVVQQGLADAFFEWKYPDAVPDQRVTGGDGPEPVRRPIIVTPLPIDQAGAGSPMTFDPVVITQHTGQDMKFEPMVITMGDAIAGPATVFEPMVITMGDAIAGPDTVFEPMVVTMDDAIAGPTTQFDVDVVDSSRYMNISPAEGMNIHSFDHMVITPAESIDFIPESMLSDTPGYSDTPDVGALQDSALDLTSFDFGFVPDAAGYLGGDLGLAGGLDFGIAWSGGDDFGVAYAGFGGGDLPAFDCGGWAGDPGGSWGGDSGGGTA